MILPVVVTFLFIKQLDTMASSEGLYEAFGQFDFISLSGINKQCEMVAYPIHPSQDHRPLYLSLQEALKIFHPNIDVSISPPLRSSYHQYRNNHDTNYIHGYESVPYDSFFRRALEVRWKVAACNTACKDAIYEVCDKYNCTDIEEKFKNYCGVYCQDMFCM